jgi:hypothetical protein
LLYDCGVEGAAKRNVREISEIEKDIKKEE